MSTFSGLNTALTSLWAQRRGLDVTGQNIANVNTEGYSRQRAEMNSIGGAPVPAIHSVSRGIGGGVDASTVTRIRDAFLEARAHVEGASQANLVELDSGLNQIQQAFREPGEAGLQSLLANMWAGWDDVANHPDDTAARSQLLQQLQTVTNGMQTTRSALDQQWTASRENLEALVSEVNVAASAVADLNIAIQRATQAGLPANELTDKRDLLVLNLSKSVGATTRPGEDGVLNVYVNGTALVIGSTATELSVAGGTTPDDAISDPARIVTTAGNYTVAPGGTAGGRLETLGSTIPTFRNRLDQVAADLAASINAGQAAGYDLDGNAGSPLLSSGPLVGPITAANITVALSDPRQIAASSAAPPPPPAAPSFDGTNADAISQSRLDPAGATTSYRRLIVDLGVQAQGVDRRLAIQSVITTQVDAARESTAGVNLDEEMTNMLSYQHAYQAAGRLVTAIDEALDILINRTGLVGR